MTSPVKSYFLAPNFDFPPGGLISLGSIITDPRKPERCLNKGKQIAIPPEELHRGLKRSWELSRAQLFETRVGVWAGFLQIVGFGGEIGISGARNSKEVYKCNRLETDYFQPSEEYILEALRDDKLKAYFAQTHYRKPIYMITGLKTARGFQVVSSSGTGLGFDGKLGIDATVGGVPIQGGPEFKLARKTTEHTGFAGSNDCVFAYSLVKIKPTKGDKVMQEDFNKHALMDDEAVEDCGTSLISNVDYTLETVEGMSGGGENVFTRDAVDDEGNDRVRLLFAKPT